MHWACKLLVQYELAWSPLRLFQRIGRLTRRKGKVGYNRNVRVAHVVVPGSVEEERVNRLLRRIEFLAEQGLWPTAAAPQAHEGAPWERTKPAPGRVGSVVKHASAIPVLCRQIEFQLQEVRHLGSVFCRPELYLELEGRPFAGRGHLDQLGLGHRLRQWVLTVGNGAEDSLGLLPGYHPGVSRRQFLCWRNARGARSMSFP